jgi:heat shock protein HtpX
MDIKEMRKRLAQDNVGTLSASEQVARGVRPARRSVTNPTAAAMAQAPPTHSATRGLFGHIQANNFKSITVFAVFLLLIQAIQLAILILMVQPEHGRDLTKPLFSNEMMSPMASVQHRLGASKQTLDQVQKKRVAPKTFLENIWMELGLIWTALITSGRLYEGRTLWIFIPSILYVVGGIWFAAVFVRRQTGAHRVGRKEEPRLHRIVEKLTISRGLPMPAVEVIESSGRNAYASGFHPSNSAVGVSRGLLDNLNDAELEAVLAHEVAHIEGRDNRLMTFANLCTGAVSSVGRNIAQWVSDSPINAIFIVFFLCLIPIVKTALFVALIFGSWCIAELVRLLISQKREFMADARAIEIMKSPAALISALQKVAQNDEIDGLAPEVQAMMISNLSDVGAGTHPSIEARILAIEETTSVNWADVQAVRRQPAPADAGYIDEAAAGAGFGRRRRRKQGEVPDQVTYLENEKLEGVYSFMVALDRTAVSVTNKLAKVMVYAPFLTWLMIPVAIGAAILSGLTGLSVSTSIFVVIGGIVCWWYRPKKLS